MLASLHQSVTKNKKQNIKEIEIFFVVAKGRRDSVIFSLFELPQKQTKNIDFGQLCLILWIGEIFTKLLLTKKQKELIFLFQRDCLDFSIKIECFFLAFSEKIW